MSENLWAIEKNKMRIGIDARLAGSKHAGIGRYTQNLIQQLLDADKVTQWILYFYNEKQAQEVLGKRISNTNVSVKITQIRHYTLDEQRYLPKIFKAGKLDLLHVPHFNIPILYKGKLIVTIHDLLWHQYRGLAVTTLNPVKYLLKYSFYRLVTRMAIKKASRIIVPAETIKNTITQYYPQAYDKIVVTKEGSKIWKQKPTKTKRLKNTLLYVGSLYPHKNIKLVLRALTQLTDYKLIITGSRNNFQDKIRTLVEQKNLTDRVQFLGYVDDKKLASLYAKATALVQPSFSEGFGLTGVEAMSFATPILASDIPIFKEIYQDVAYYFSPYSTASFISAVHALAQSKKTESTDGPKLAKTYSWKKMTQQTQLIYNEVTK